MNQLSKRLGFAAMISLTLITTSLGDELPRSVARQMYSQKGDVRRHLDRNLIEIENSVSPSWLYGGFYPDSPKIKFVDKSMSSHEAEIQVKIFVDDNDVQRTLHFVHRGQKWIVDRVSLDVPEHRSIP